jgi:calcineurin-like phosphoesterase family protein
MAWRDGKRAHRSKNHAGMHKKNRYLILVRVADQTIQDFIETISDEYGFRREDRKIPHITLAGPFTLRGTGPDVRILGAVEKSAPDLTHLSCTPGRFLYLKGRRGFAIAFDLSVTDEFRTFYTTLSTVLQPYQKTSTTFDKNPEKRRFHITVGFNLPGALAGEVWSRLHAVPRVSGYVRNRKGFWDRDSACGCTGHLNSYRVSVLRNGTLWREYDLPGQRWLYRNDIFSRYVMSETLRMYRIKEGLELESPDYSEQDECYVLSDTHFNHANIIRYCRRPFTDAEEMNRVLLRNWNYRVKETDRVFLLGDLAYGPVIHPAEYYLSHMNGKIVLIAGNHDTDLAGTVPYCEKELFGIRFLFIHDPDQAPASYDGWIVHGHAHNNDIEMYPFFDGRRHRINVSSELAGFIPVNLREIAGYIRSAERDTVFISLRDARNKLENIKKQGL